MLQATLLSLGVDEDTVAPAISTLEAHRYMFDGTYQARLALEIDHQRCKEQAEEDVGRVPALQLPRHVAWWPQAADDADAQQPHDQRQQQQWRRPGGPLPQGHGHEHRGGAAAAESWMPQRPAVLAALRLDGTGDRPHYTEGMGGPELMRISGHSDSSAMQPASCCSVRSDVTRVMSFGSAPGSPGSGSQALSQALPQLQA